MTNVHTWIDEVEFFQRTSPDAQSTYSQMLSNLRFWGVESTQIDREHRQRMELKNRRSREMRNCQHGRMPFPISWAAGIHPAGDRVAQETEWVSLGPFQAPSQT